MLETTAFKGPMPCSSHSMFVLRHLGSRPCPICLVLNAKLCSQDIGIGRSRRMANESGSFGKSTRRSRSKTATPARREDPVVTAADKVFTTWIQQQSRHTESRSASTSAGPTAGSASYRKASGVGLQADESSGAPAAAQRIGKEPKREPKEIVLRGYRSTAQQYAAINHFEQLAGRICEDYPREPPVESRRYKSELRDPALTRRQGLTEKERKLVNKAGGGEHWIKVTFESKEAAEAALSVSPQSVLGHLVYAEPWLEGRPTRDEAIPDLASHAFDAGDRVLGELRLRTPTRRRHGNHASLSDSSRLPGRFETFDGAGSQQSQTSSSRTVDTTTLTGDSNTGTITGLDSHAAADTGNDAAAAQASQSSEFCARIPTAKKAKLEPAEKALLPQASYTQRVLNKIPFLKWFSGSMIGNQVPRTDTGEFDWDKASLYWKVMCWLDQIFRLFGGEVVNADKDDEEDMPLVQVPKRM